MRSEKSVGIRRGGKGRSALPRRFFAALSASALLFSSCVATEEETQGGLRFSLSKDEIRLACGETYVLYLIKTPADGKKTPVEWIAENPSVAIVAEGKVTAIRAGVTYVIARTEEYTLSCKITVEERSALQCGTKPEYDAK